MNKEFKSNNTTLAEFRLFYLTLLKCSVQIVTLNNSLRMGRSLVKFVGFCIGCDQNGDGCPRTIYQALRFYPLVSLLGRGTYINCCLPVLGD